MANINHAECGLGRRVGVNPANAGSGFCNGGCFRVSNANQGAAGEGLSLFPTSQSTAVLKNDKFNMDIMWIFEISAIQACACPGYYVGRAHRSAVQEGALTRAGYRSRIASLNRCRTSYREYRAQLLIR